MSTYLQLLFLITVGIILLWFGYSIVIGLLLGKSRGNTGSKPAPLFKQTTRPGDPQVCPVCSSRLMKGELIKSVAFPSITGGKDRLMHIQGCVYCLEGDCPRRCPVCGATLRDNEILIARVFDRGRRRSHVHIMGCSRCIKIGRP